ncbi:MAG: sigma factor [Hyphomonadaceae bacterium]
MTAKLISFPKGNPEQVPDPDLASKAASGDRAAFTQLMQRHQATVRGMMRRLTKGNQADADDLAQATFLRAWRQIGTYSGGYTGAVNSYAAKCFGRC